MKKILLLAVLFTALVSGTVSAQGGGPGGDPAVMKARMKERVKPQLLEKTKLTDEQAEKVLDINFDASRQRRELRNDTNLTDDDRKKKTAAIEEETTKKYKAIPLTDEQVKSVNDFFEEMRKNMPQRQGGNR
jgi:Spy/CpxP family protein refolding chaperone